MNVIRVNWPLVRCLCLALFVLYLTYLLIYLAFKQYDPTLTYAPETGDFLINRERAAPHRLNFTDAYGRDASKARFKIRSVLIRYAITPVEYWPRLLEDAILLGVNTIEIQVVWSLHEPMFKHFDFTQKSNDLETFISESTFFVIFCWYGKSAEVVVI